MNPNKSTQSCIACSACETQCPVSTPEKPFPGRYSTGTITQEYTSQPDPTQSCSYCKICDIICPQGISLSRQNMLTRSHQYAQKRPPMRNWILSHSERLSNIFAFLPSRLRNWCKSNSLSRSFLASIGLTPYMSFPPFAPKTFYAYCKNIRQPASDKKIALFPGCHINLYDPQAGLDLVWLLNRAGYEVWIPQNFVCCGLPLITNGFWEEAKTHTLRNMATLLGCRQMGIPVITACPSCSVMFKEDLPAYFPDAMQNLENTALLDAHAFILSSLETGVLPPPDMSADQQGTLLYHAPCHMRVQGLGLPALELLQSIKNLAVVRADAQCCGLAGTHGFKKEHYTQASELGKVLSDTAITMNVSLTSSECGSCRTQLQHITGKNSLHPLSILRRHYSES